MKKIFLALSLMLSLVGAQAQISEISGSPQTYSSSSATTMSYQSQQWLPGNYIRSQSDNPVGPWPYQGMSYDDYVRYQDRERKLAQLEALRKHPGNVQVQQRLIQQLMLETNQRQDDRPYQDNRPAQ